MGMRVTIVGASLAAVVISLSACGSDDNSAAPSSAVAPSATAVAPPTPDQLTKLLQTLLDSQQPPAEKAKLITNGAAKIPKIDEFTKKLRGYKVGVNPTKITAQGTTASSEVLVTSAMAPSAPAPVPMTFDFSGDWKLSEASTCAIFAFAQVQC